MTHLHKAHPPKTEDETGHYLHLSVLAQRQGGFVTTKQLLDLGVAAHWIKYQARKGQLIRAYKGIYAVGHMPTEPRARAFAAQLAPGPRSALAAGSAASFYGFFRRWSEPFELLSPLKVRHEGLIVRTTSKLLQRDVWTVQGLKVTSPARTALDLAPRLTQKRLQAAVDHLRLRSNLDLPHLHDVLARNQRHPGAAALQRVVGSAARNPSRSGFERQWPAFARRFNLPPYETNVKVAGIEVDVLVAGAVIVELDTFQTHLLNFASDRDRDATILAATGIPTIRVTSEQFRNEPELLAQRILRVVAGRGASALFGEAQCQ